MVNLGKDDLKQFIRSGALLSASDGTFFLGINNAESYSGADQDVFYVQPFFSIPKKLNYQKNLRLTQKELLDFLSLIQEQKPEVKFSGPDKDTYKNIFESCQNEIAQTRLNKVVLYSSKKSAHQLTDQEKIYFLKSLLQNNQSKENYLYAYFNGDEGFCGLTPEILFLKHGDSLKTMALAGTASIDKPMDEFLNDQKERAEHALVVDYLKNELSHFGKVKSKKIGIKKYSSLQHLITPMEVDVVDASYEKIVASLHPTPALGGFPRQAALGFLLKTDELMPRKYFGAPFGVQTASGELFSVVAIRGLFWQKDELKIYSGGGVIEQSKFDNEWSEIIMKLKTIENNLGLNG